MGHNPIQHHGEDHVKKEQGPFYVFGLVATVFQNAVDLLETESDVGAAVREAAKHVLEFFISPNPFQGAVKALLHGLGVMQSRDHVIPDAGRKEEVKPRLPLTQCRHKTPETGCKGIEGRRPGTIPFALGCGFGHGPVSSGATPIQLGFDAVTTIYHSRRIHGF